MKKEKSGGHFVAKRSLGQNFLIAPRVAEHIARLATRPPENTRRSLAVLEVGPGKGVLTRELLKRAARVIAVEKDDLLYKLLQTTFAKEIKERRLDLVHDDALSWLTTGYKLLPTSYTVAANIPYNLTGELLRLFLEAEPKPMSVTVLVQKEVAERIAANKGRESILSLSIKAYGEPRIEGKVPRTLFRPVPSVDSAILHITNVSNSFFDKLLIYETYSGAREKDFFELLKIGFAQKRKFLLSNLSAKHERALVVATFEKIGLDPKIRAERLSLEQWGVLFLSLYTGKAQEIPTKALE